MRITVWPKRVNRAPVSTTVRPVTQTAEVEVKSRSMNGRGGPTTAIGRLKRITPMDMRARKLKMRILAGCSIERKCRW